MDAAKQSTRRKTMHHHGWTVEIIANTPSHAAIKETNKIINQIAKRHYAK